MYASFWWSDQLFILHWLFALEGTLYPLFVYSSSSKDQVQSISWQQLRMQRALCLQGVECRGWRGGHCIWRGRSKWSCLQSHQCGHCAQAQIFCHWFTGQVCEVSSQTAQFGSRSWSTCTLLIVYFPGYHIMIHLQITLQYFMSFWFRIVLTICLQDLESHALRECTSQPDTDWAQWRSECCRYMPLGQVVLVRKHRQNCQVLCLQPKDQLCLAEAGCLVSPTVAFFSALLTYKGIDLNVIC